MPDNLEPAQGILLIDKPKDWTSFDVVNYVRSIVARDAGRKPRNFKVGHTGTLDPEATGLLVLCVGKTYTKKVPELIRHDKTYEAEITFGSSSDTGDAAGVITKDKDAVQVTEDALKQALIGFVGIQMQTPPIYSAIKVGGKRAYDLARAGKEVKMQPREIVIHSIELVSLNWPIANIVCSVGSGTYIRVLAEDVAAAVGNKAFLSGLRRTVVDKWKIEDATPVKSINIDIIREKLLA